MLTLDDLNTTNREDAFFLRDLTNPERLQLSNSIKSSEKRKDGIYSPSGLWNCSRQQYYRRARTQRQYNIRPSTQGIFDVGHAVHEYWQKVDAKLYGDHQYTPEAYGRLPNLHMEGSTDALIELPFVRFVKDYKTINDRGFAALHAPLPSNVWQIIAYCVMFDVPFGWISYINKLNGMTKHYWVLFDAQIWSAIENKLRTIEDHYKRGAPPDKEISYKCPECPYMGICDPYGGKK